MYLTPGLRRHVLSMNYHLQIPAGLAEDFISASLPSAPRSSPPRWHPEQRLRFSSNPSDNWHVACCLLNTVKFIRMKGLFFSAVLHVSVRACTCTSLTPFYPSLCRSERCIDVKLPSAVRSHFNTHASRLLLSAMISAWFPKLRFQRLHIISVFTYLLFILKPEWRSPVWLIIPKKEELWLPSVTSQQAHFHSRVGFSSKWRKQDRQRLFPSLGGSVAGCRRTVTTH